MNSSELLREFRVLSGVDSRHPTVAQAASRYLSEASIPKFRGDVTKMEPADIERIVFPARTGASTPVGLRDRFSDKQLNQIFHRADFTKFSQRFRDWMYNWADSQTNEETEDGDPLDVFNGKLAKLMQRLKKDAGAETIKMNYRGTGSRKARRQLWVRFKNGAVIDLWLDTGFLGFSGVVKSAAPNAPTLPSRIPYGDNTPEQIYKMAADLLKPWATAGDTSESTNEEEEVTPEFAKAHAATSPEAVSAIFNKLKSGQTVWMAYKAVMGSGDLSFKPYTVGRRSLSKKYNTTKISLLRPGQKSASSMMGINLYRMGNEETVQVALGDMGASLLGLYVP